MSTLAQRAREAWLADASWTGHGICDRCGLERYLVRKRGARRRLCLECWDQSPISSSRPPADRALTDEGHGAR